MPQTVRDCAAQWVQSTFLEVREMTAARVVQPTVGRAWRKTWGDEFAARAIDCTSQFLGGGGQRLHRLAASALMSPFRRRRRTKFKELESFLSPGSLARVRSGGSSPVVAGCLVQVVRRLRSLSATSVSAALDLHSWFAVCRSPGSTGSLSSNCWGAVRVHHRCRLLMSPDAACEGVGSIMRLQWDSRRSTGEVAGRVADSVALSAAGVRCVGAARDEALVAEVVATLRGKSRYRPRRLNVQSAHVADLGGKYGAAAGGDFALGIPAAGMGSPKRLSGVRL